MTVQKQVVTVREFEDFIARPENRDRLFELIDGEIVEKMVTQEHGILAGNFVTFLNLWLWQNPIGRVAVEARYRPIDKEENDRLPDVSFVADLSKEVVRKGAALFMPDLAIEIKSPDDSFRKMRETARFYLANGVKMVWLVFPEQRVIEVYTLDDEFVVGENGTLTGGDVLPGFSVAVRDLFKNI
jgi:Uma2 family endonuclease